jgi:hypothetical protein
MNTPNMAAVASVTENETYIGNRLTFHNDISQHFSGHVPTPWVYRIWRRTRALGLGSATLVLLVQLVSADWDRFPNERFWNGFSLGWIVWVAVLVVVASLLVPLNEGLSEWQLMLDGKAGSADSAYAAIFGTLRTRQIPVAVTTRRFRTAGHPSVNNFLVVGDNHVFVYVSVFAYGTSLYLGWTMWRRQLPVVLVWKWLAETIGGMFGRNARFMGQLASNRDRALREAVHSAVREGLDAVNYGVDVPVGATFGYEVPVETLGAPAAPQAVPQPFTAPVPSQPMASAPVPPAPYGAPVPPVPPQGGAPVPPAPPVAPAPYSGGAQQ